MADVLLELEHGNYRLTFYMRDDGKVGLTIESGPESWHEVAMVAISAADLFDVAYRAAQRMKERWLDPLDSVLKSGEG
jgi:hypothetical protein